GLRALAEGFRKRQEQRQHRDQQRNLLVAAVQAVRAMDLAVLDLMLDLMLNRFHAFAHVASPSAPRTKTRFAGSLSRPRMSAAVDLEQALGIERGVDLRGR